MVKPVSLFYAGAIALGISSCAFRSQNITQQITSEMLRYRDISCNTPSGEIKRLDYSKSGPNPFDVVLSLANEKRGITVRLWNPDKGSKNRNLQILYTKFDPELEKESQGLYIGRADFHSDFNQDGKFDSGYKNAPEAPRDRLIHSNMIDNGTTFDAGNSKTNPDFQKYFESNANEFLTLLRMCANK